MFLSGPGGTRGDVVRQASRRVATLAEDHRILLLKLLEVEPATVDCVQRVAVDGVLELMAVCSDVVLVSADDVREEERVE